MHTYNLKVLSYHRFTEQAHDYAFSRTYKQFAGDLVRLDFDWITIDDGHQSMIKACAMMQEKNIRAKLFVSTQLIGQAGYCTWGDLWKLSKFHDIENHSHAHVKLTELSDEDIFGNIEHASYIIKGETGRQPRYFAAPWNQWDVRVEKAATELKLHGVRERIDIKNAD